MSEYCDDPRCLEALHTSLASVSLPLLILHGDNDSLCQPAGSHLLARWAAVHSTQYRCISQGGFLER